MAARAGTSAEKGDVKEVEQATVFVAPSLVGEDSEFGKLLEGWFELPGETVRGWGMILSGGNRWGFAGGVAVLVNKI